jgi:cysteine desulfurase
MELRYLEFLKHVARRRRRVYLDHNATTPVSRRVRRRMNHVLKHGHGNPSALHESGRRAAALVEEARLQVAEAIHAGPGEVYFTGCATESNNAVLKSLADRFYPQRKKIVSTPIEHPSVLRALDYLQGRGIVVEYCPVDRQGRVRLDALAKLVDGDTFLVCCMLANNEIGTIQDIAAVAGIARRHGVLVLADCVQALGKISIDVRGWGIDYASFSAHKLYGPKGVGALYVRKGSPFSPWMHGGHQENGMRAGTESLHNIAGFGAACAQVGKLLARAERIRALKGRLLQMLKAVKPDLVVNSPDERCLPNTLSVTLPGVDQAEMMAVLDHYGVAVSAGSACSSQDDRPSPTLKAIGLSDQAARQTLRISLGYATSQRDIRYAARVFRDHLLGRSLFVDMIAPGRLDEAAVFDEATYILDVRPQFLRRKFAGLPNSHEAPFVSLGKYLPQLPRDRRILAVCQHGNLSYIAAYYLRSKGFTRVGSLKGGVAGWKARHADLYQKHAGKNITALRQEKQRFSLD